LFCIYFTVLVVKYYQISNEFSLRLQNYSNITQKSLFNSYSGFLIATGESGGLFIFVARSTEIAGVSRGTASMGTAPKTGVASGSEISVAIVGYSTTGVLATLPPIPLILLALGAAGVRESPAAL